MNMEFRRKLPTAKEVREMYPLSPAAAAKKDENDRAIREVFLGKSDRLILIIGPCSADREDAVLEYVSRLAAVQKKVREKILIIPRIYTNKPRTTGDGYKGMLHQPDPEGVPDIFRGLLATRRLHLHVLEEFGFSTADELLYPEDYPYLADLLSYVAVGARSVEDQQHRLAASGLDIPVGMKNPTGGDLSVMMHSITAAQHPHTFLFAGWEVESKGNPLTHAILRGWTDRNGVPRANYHREDLLALSALFAGSGLCNPGVIVDTNHCNSGRRFEEQPRIAREVLQSAREVPELGRLVKGLMVESYLVDGAGAPEDGVFGRSITDPCLGWEKTEELILGLV